MARVNSSEAHAATDTSESVLVEKAIYRNSEAFAQLYDRHVEGVYRRVFYKVFNHSEAEDITQEVFIKAWKAIHRYRQTGASFVSWLIAIAHNLVVDHYKSKKQMVSLDESLLLEDGDPGPEVRTECNVEGHRIRKAIFKLRSDKQRVILMRFIDGLSYKEVALALHKSEGAIRVIQYRALTDLKRLLVKDERC